MSDRHDEEHATHDGRRVLTGRWGFTLVDGRVLVSRRALVKALRHERGGSATPTAVRPEPGEDAPGG